MVDIEISTLNNESYYPGEEINFKAVLKNTNKGIISDNITVLFDNQLINVIFDKNGNLVKRICLKDEYTIFYKGIMDPHCIETKIMFNGDSNSLFLCPEYPELTMIETTSITSFDTIPIEVEYTINFIQHNNNFNNVIYGELNGSSLNLYPSNMTYKFTDEVIRESKIPRIDTYKYINGYNTEELISSSSIINYKLINNVTKKIINKGSAPNGDFIVGDKIDFMIEIKGNKYNEYILNDTMIGEITLYGNSNYLYSYITEDEGNINSEVNFV